MIRRRWQVLIVLLLFLFGAGLLGVDYVNRVVLPVKGRIWVETIATEALGRKVTVGSVHLHLWHGAVIDNITVQEDGRYGTEPFLRIARVSGKLLYLPLLKTRQLIIPTLQIVRPECRILQDPNGVWNFQSLKSAGSAGRSSFPRLLIPKIVLEQGTLDVKYRQGERPLHLRFEKLDAQIGLSLPAKPTGKSRRSLFPRRRLI